MQELLDFLSVNSEPVAAWPLALLLLAGFAAATAAVGGSLIPVPGGVLVRDDAGTLLGAVGISGDTSDNDEVAAVAGIEAAGLQAQPG